ncbi:MAG: lactate/malate family dehydrogenase [Vicinamibacterales bacterium]
MREVAIIGAGELGGAVAHALARSNLVQSVRIIDAERRVAEGKALDIAQAAPVEGFATRASGGSDVSMAAGAFLVIIADRIAGGEWRGEDALALLKRLSQTAARAAIVCAGPSQHELVERGVGELRLSRTRLFGSAPESLAAAARALVALAVNGSPRDVALSVLGLPPEHTVIPWADATVAGLSLTRLVDEQTRRQLAMRVSALWPTGPYALAAAVTTVVEAMTGRSRRIVSSFVAPDFSAGRRARTTAMPVRLGASGIVEIVSPSLSNVEQVALDNAMML